MEPALEVQAQMNFSRGGTASTTLATTTANKANLEQKIDPRHLLYLRRLLRLYPIHVIAVHPHPDAIAYLDAQAFLFHFVDHGLDATARDNAVAFFRLASICCISCVVSVVAERSGSKK